MGLTTSSPYGGGLQLLLDAGFDPSAAAAALDACDGDAQRALQHLRRRNRQSTSAATHANVADAHSLVDTLNTILREQRPWAEFAERFLLPDHPRERLLTNLLYYRGNYCVITCFCVAVGLLLQPTLLLASLGSAGLVFAAMTYEESSFTLEQRLSAAGLSAAVLLHRSGAVMGVARIAIVCFGICGTHAMFRARSLSSRWRHLYEQMKQE